jgi:hypothetical protein
MDVSRHPETKTFEDGYDIAPACVIRRGVPLATASLHRAWISAR